MEFEYKEKLGILKAILSVMVADSKVHPKEEQYLLELKNELGFTLEDIEAATALDVKPTIEILKAMDDEKKAHLSSMIQDMIKIDEVIHPKETETARVIFEAVGISLNFEE